MVQQRHKDLVRLVNYRTGKALRSAFAYNTDDWTPLYVRDDVATAELKRAMEESIPRVRRSDPIARAEEYGRIGETQATVELHDRAVIILIRESHTSGVLVSLDREIAQDLAAFISECVSALDGGS